MSKSLILFLDVDGVLNSYKTGGRYALKRNCLRRLQRIVEETGCKIVLSSTWRKDEYALRRLKRVLSYRNLTITSVTPSIQTLGAKRGDEINEWLKESKLDYWEQKDVKYAILDDDSDMLYYQLPSFFQTDPEYGLTDTITYRVIYHLTH